jgi:hypothetical protein
MSRPILQRVLTRFLELINRLATVFHGERGRRSFLHAINPGFFRLLCAHSTAPCGEPMFPR